MGDNERNLGIHSLQDTAAAQPMGRWKPYRTGNSTGAKRDVASWSYFGSNLLNAKEPYQWEVEDYECAVKYKRENMGQWWTTKNKIKNKMNKAQQQQRQQSRPSQTAG